MSTPANDMFYVRLPVNELGLSELLGEEHLFFSVPVSWTVVITDIKDSTKAIANGMHETINLLATGCIVAVLNITHQARITVPFFFGGDGATFIIPPAIHDAVLRALVLHQQNILANFNLELRVGAIAVADIYNKGHELKITRLRTSQSFTIPILLGEGLSYAEHVIKGMSYQLDLEGKLDVGLDLSGMQCKWDKIKPPLELDEVVSLLVVARPGIRQAHAFKQVIDKLDEIYGSPDRRKPISIPKLKLKATIEKLGLEMRARFGGWRVFYFLFNWLKTSLGFFYFKTKKGKKYLQQLVALSDTLIIDGKINTVISGTSGQRLLLITALDKLEQEGLLYYGLYVSNESVMSCYVRNLQEDHIHFVDGAGGGYTRAAGVLKRKFAGV